MGANDDLKAKMREALDKKKSGGGATNHGAEAKEKAHGSEVVGQQRRVHRRKSG
jgi:hypothetical protein